MPRETPEEPPPRPRLQADDVESVREFARRFRLSLQEERRLLARHGSEASRRALLIDARRDLPA